MKKDFFRAHQTNVGTRWTVSHKWLTKKHDCTLAGIRGRCHGGCCHSATYWPPVAYDGPDKACGMLGPAGCQFSDADKPITCLLYPLILNKYGQLGLHIRATTGKGVCKGNHGKGPMLIDALRLNLIELFGVEQFDRVRREILAGRDSYFVVSDKIALQYSLEKVMADKNLPPVPRTKGS